MEIKTEKQQIRERIIELDDIISEQQERSVRAYRRYEMKSDWAFTFWIWNNSSTLKFIYDREELIKQNLIDYRQILRDKLLKNQATTYPTPPLKGE